MPAALNLEMFALMGNDLRLSKDGVPCRLPQGDDFVQSPVSRTSFAMALDTIEYVCGFARRVRAFPGRHHKFSKNTTILVVIA